MRAEHSWGERFRSGRVRRERFRPCLATQTHTFRSSPPILHIFFPNSSQRLDQYSKLAPQDCEIGIAQRVTEIQEQLSKHFNKLD